ncbi:hypothetical protein EVAR_36124_1 [Eumeta japonica]|uniref:Uncharacterized protein n=1 Tax=Eumeta variegata TaxID=151549 RepID=A0A4C1X3A5_EUMVA|nr:hypothetical protein EVAR_36124_1 [Eumeta japonica]
MKILCEGHAVVKLAATSDLGRFDSPLIESRREVIISSFAFRPVSESSGGSTPFDHSTTYFYQPTLPCIKYPISTQEAGNALVAPLELRVSMGCVD